MASGGPPKVDELAEKIKKTSSDSLNKELINKWNLNSDDVIVMSRDELMQAVYDFRSGIKLNANAAEYTELKESESELSVELPSTMSFAEKAMAKQLETLSAILKTQSDALSSILKNQADNEEQRTAHEQDQASRLARDRNKLSERLF